MRVVRNTFRLKYTNFILTIDSGLDKEEKIKNKMIFFTFIFISLLGKLEENKYIKKNSGLINLGMEANILCQSVVLF